MRVRKSLSIRSGSLRSLPVLSSLLLASRVGGVREGGSSVGSLVGRSVSKHHRGRVRSRSRVRRVGRWGNSLRSGVHRRVRSCVHRRRRMRFCRCVRSVSGIRSRGSSRFPRHHFSNPSSFPLQPKCASQSFATPAEQLNMDQISDPEMFILADATSRRSTLFPETRTASTAHLPASSCPRLLQLRKPKLSVSYSQTPSSHHDDRTVMKMPKRAQ